METNNKKTASKKGQKPAHTVRRGAIAANIWARQTQTGHEYFEYSLSRSWKSQSTGKEGYSSNFGTRSRDQLLEVVEEATAWIAEKEGPALETERDSAGEPNGVAIGRITPVKVPADQAIVG